VWWTTHVDHAIEQLSCGFLDAKSGKETSYFDPCERPWDGIPLAQRANASSSSNGTILANTPNIKRLTHHRINFSVIVRRYSVLDRLRHQHDRMDSMQNRPVVSGSVETTWTTSSRRRHLLSCIQLGNPYANTSDAGCIVAAAIHDRSFAQR